MIVLFWGGALVVIYAFVGYAALTWLLARVRPRPVKKRSIQPSVSIVMAVHNGARFIEPKLKNLFEVAYPKKQLEIIVASDGSTDDTAAVATSFHGVRVVVCPRVGKAEALNRALALSHNEIVVFADVRQRIQPEAIAELVANFADEDVGCVSGELMFSPQTTKGSVSGLSTYWRLEKAIRKCESESGSVMGATGALYAVRRSLIKSLPPGTLLDDVYMPLQVLRQGKRVIFEPKARVWDAVTERSRSEFLRKVRTLAGNFQIIALMPWVFTDRATRFRFVSHKVTRLVAPWALVGCFCSSWILAGSSLYLTLAILQTAFYVLALVAAIMPNSTTGGLIGTIKAFCLMNAAAATALFSYARHRNDPRRIWASSSVPVPNPEAICPATARSAETNH